jgi:hypothetical protein
MCGRFTLRTNPSDLVEIFSLLREPELTPRWSGIARSAKLAECLGRDPALLKLLGRQIHQRWASPPCPPVSRF